MIKRILDLKAVHESFFFGGLRQTGKTVLLKEMFPTALYVDLLLSDQFVKYQSHPERLREELRLHIDRHTVPKTVIVDEIQKVPALLDEIHCLIENTAMRFGLCGSSARKVRRSQANLLGGRARRFGLHGFSAIELGDGFELVRMLNHGYLPRHYLSDSPAPLIRAYTVSYFPITLQPRARVASGVNEANEVSVRFRPSESSATAISPPRLVARSFPGPRLR